jgi:hypothetical protein
MLEFGVTIGVTIGVIVAIALAMRQKVNDRGGCPECFTPVPAFRRPTSFRQALWGGWTCETCGCELDRNGREIVVHRSS